MALSRVQGSHLSDRERSIIRQLVQFEKTQRCDVLQAEEACATEQDDCVWKSEACVAALTFQADQCQALSKDWCQNMRKTCRWHPSIESKAGRCEALTRRTSASFYAQAIELLTHRERRALLRLYKINVEELHGGDVRAAPTPVHLPRRSLLCSVEFNAPGLPAGHVRFHNGREKDPTVLSPAELDDWWSINGSPRDIEYEIVALDT